VITEADLPRIEEKMYELSRRNSPYVREEISKSDVLSLSGKKKMSTKLN